MKKYLLGAFAVVLAVGFSAFTTSATKVEKKQTQVILVYSGSGAQNQIANYSQTLPLPSCPGATVLCALRVTDPNGNGTITQSEFNTIFPTFDKNSNGTLNDESEITNTNLFLKS